MIINPCKKDIKYPYVLNEEIEIEKNEFISKLQNLKINKEYFIPMSEIPIKDFITCPYSRRWDSREIIINKRQCGGIHWETTKRIYIEKRFCKFKNKYGVIVFWEYKGEK